MSEHQRIKSGILAIILGLGISMCTPMLYLLVKAILHEPDTAGGMHRSNHEESLHAQSLPGAEFLLDKELLSGATTLPEFKTAPHMVFETDKSTAQIKNFPPYLMRYLNSMRPFPKAFLTTKPVEDIYYTDKTMVSNEIPRMDGSEEQAEQREIPDQKSESHPGTEMGATAAAQPGTAEQQVLLSESGIPILAHSQVLAYYGRPGTRSMGILGQYRKEELAPMLEKLAKEYDALNGDLGIVPAFYIIFGTCWPEGTIGYLSKAVVREYIEFALARGWLVFLDHQIGKHDVVQSLETMFEFLEYPNVHLALDPEWRTTKPMKEIGYVTADEINKAQERFQEYLVANKLPGPRMLVIHQFHYKMIMNRDAVQATYDQVILVHCADGFGNPSLKKSTYAMIAKAKNIPVKGFKLFYPPAIQGAGWDNPLMSPADILKLDPMPLVIMYQ